MWRLVLRVVGDDHAWVAGWDELTREQLLVVVAERAGLLDRQAVQLEQQATQIQALTEQVKALTERVKELTRLFGAEFGELVVAAVWRSWSATGPATPGLEP